MIHIYRIQDMDGRGPFKKEFTDKWLADRDVSHLKSFHPIQIFGAKNRTKAPFIGCGCTSIEQLKKWFTLEEYYFLLSQGYESVIISVDEILLSDKNQVLFARHRPLRRGFKKFNLYERDIEKEKLLLKKNKCKLPGVVMGIIY